MGGINGDIIHRDLTFSVQINKVVFTVSNVFEVLLYNFSSYESKECNNSYQLLCLYTAIPLDLGTVNISFTVICYSNLICYYSC